MHATCECLTVSIIKIIFFFWTMLNNLYSRYSKNFVNRNLPIKRKYAINWCQIIDPDPLNAEIRMRKIIEMIKSKSNPCDQLIKVVGYIYIQIQIKRFKKAKLKKKKKNLDPYLVQFYYAVVA